jgi:hypothetical protein
VYENKGAGKFEGSLSFPGWDGACEDESISRHRRVSLVPYPVPRFPLNKNEGASGDMYENKGPEK